LNNKFLLKFSLLYKIIAEELKTIRYYIIKNLNKNFIIPSSAFFILSILIARKSGEGFYIYIDYRKLNILTKKNLYLLFLINKIIN
ncbi:uncharacterized protein BO66DRAFT_310110, partial [Aspergillus aculeatinus CBS 121060]